MMTLDDTIVSADWRP